VVTILIGGLDAVEVDEVGRPLAFYKELIHDNCPRRGHFDEDRFARRFSDPYCLYELGCKGPVAHADCPIRLWNSGTNWCVGSSSPCIGCVEPGFPDKISPFRKVEFLAVTSSAFPPQADETEVRGTSLPGIAAVGAGAIGAGIGVAATIAVQRRRKSKEGKEEE
jgi:hydrogenase small subunit